MRTRTSLVAAVVLAIGGTASGQPTSKPSPPAATRPTPPADLAPPAPPVIEPPPPPPVLEQPTAVPAAPVAPPAAPTPPPPASAPATTELAPPFRLASPSAQSDAVAPPTTADVGGGTTRPVTPEGGTAAPGELGTRVVTSDLDRTREQIAPSLGAETYTISPAQIQNIPGGENAPFQQVLLRAPGVVEDSFGQEHVRGEHGNLTYRINGVLLPQPINVFGQEIDTRIISSVTLIDGTLPAQFGLHTAGIVDVTTKTGATLNHNELSLYGGSYDTIQPSLQLGGTTGNLDYFVAASYNHNGLGIENTDLQPPRAARLHGPGAGLRIPLLPHRRHQPAQLHHQRLLRRLPDPRHGRLAPGFHARRQPRPPIRPRPTRTRTSRSITPSWPTRRPSSNLSFQVSGVHPVRADHLPPRPRQRPDFPGRGRRGLQQLRHLRHADRRLLRPRRPAHAPGRLPRRLHDREARHHLRRLPRRRLRGADVRRAVRPSATTPATAPSRAASTSRTSSS